MSEVVQRVPTSDEQFQRWMDEAIEEAKQYDTCMAVRVNEAGKSVELIIDTSSNYYAEWIRGEGGDICLYRDQDTKKVVGCRLPLVNDKLSVFHEGPIRVNSGFRKKDNP